jgi:hypothetical protein
MSKDPEFVVTMWLKLNERAAELTETIAQLEPFESSKYEGMRDFHWKFSDRDQAETFAYALKELSDAPEVVLLRLTNYDDVRTTLKDSRQTTH